MALINRTYVDIFSDEQSLFMKSSPIAQMYVGGKARSFLEVMALELSRTYSDVSYNVSQTFLKTAVGDNLDAIGEMFGVYRLQEVAPTVIPEDRSLKFYVKTGTFGDINSKKDIVIPAGTRITGKNSSVSYEVTSPVTLGLGTSVGYAAAVSKIAGAKGNIPQSSLDQHDFYKYSDSLNKSLLVVNDYPIDSGRDAESDNNYRYRISQKLLELEKCNLTALYANILKLPGVKDIRVSRYENGLGTATIYVYGVEPNKNPVLQQQAQSMVDDISAVGDKIIVKVPEMIKISFAATLTFKSARLSGIDPKLELNPASKDAIVDIVKTNVINYFRSLEIDDSFTIPALVATIVGADPNIQSIGKDNALFDSLLIWRTAPNGVEFSNYLTKDYVPKDGEQLTLKDMDVSYV